MWSNALIFLVLGCFCGCGVLGVVKFLCFSVVLFNYFCIFVLMKIVEHQKR